MIRNTLCALVLLVPALARAAERPNFVIMMTDDQRGDALSCAGNTILKTPNMDRIGNEGIRFTNAFVTNALCAPSRATLLTGQYSHSHGVIDNKNRKIDPQSPFLADLLRQAGYEVAFVGKSHIAGALRDRDWDYYFGFQGQGSYFKPVIAEGTTAKDQAYEGWMDDVTTDHAVKWLEKKHDKPFCLFLFFKAPHRSWDRPPRHKDLYKDVTIPKPDTYDLGLKGDPQKPKAFNDADNKVGNDKDIMDFRAVRQGLLRLPGGGRRQRRQGVRRPGEDQAARQHHDALHRRQRLLPRRMGPLRQTADARTVDPRAACWSAIRS